MPGKAPKKLLWQEKWWLSFGKAAETRRRKRWVLLQLEELETRSLLSASVALADPATAASAVNESIQTNASVSPQAPPSFNGYTPQQLQTAYNVSPLLGSGTNGSGETIAIIDAYDDPKIQKDLATFDSKYSLPAANLTVLNEFGEKVTPKSIQNDGGPYPDPTGGWEVEESLDVEWAHAIAPGANIVLYEADSNYLDDLLTAVNTAVNQGANVVSMSWGGSEFNGETYFDSSSFFTAPGVTFVASAGDGSAYAGPQWPASSPNVLAVGGTTLNLTSGTYTETAWSATDSRKHGWEGGGGGASIYEVEPPFQTANVGTYLNGNGDYGFRSTPDVSWDANPTTGVSIYDSYPSVLKRGWTYVGGTSAGAPAWAGIVALADQQYGSSHNGNSLSTAQVEPTLYGIYHNNPSSAAYTSDFNDITIGNNGDPAGPGYDLATGLGSPNVANIVPLLASSSSPASTLGSSSSGGSVVSGGSTGSHSGHHVAGFIAVAAFDEVGASGASLAVSAADSGSSSSLPLSPSSGAAANSNGLFLLGSPGQGMQAVTAANSTNATAAANVSVGQANILFGASGWKESASSWNLSSLGLPGSLAEPLAGDADDRPDGEDSDSSAWDTSAGMGDDFFEEDRPIFDGETAPALGDGGAISGGE